MEDQKDTNMQALMEWKYSKQWNDSEIDDIFGFQLHNQVVCPECGYISHRFEYLTSLEVPLPEQASTVEVRSISLSVIDLLSTFVGLLD